MIARLTPVSLTVACLAAALLAFAACQDDAAPAGSTQEVTSGRDPDASVSGSVTYRERIALTEGATLIVELRDVSLQDAAAPLIARQTISDPGQVPIKFKVEYNRDDINSRNVYSIQARIEESDGRLAFINDTAYEVITRGNPSKVDMVLVLVQPPPELVEEGEDWRTWVEVPARVISANLMPKEPEFLRVVYYQSTIEGCARRGNEGLELDGNDILVSVTLMQPPQTAWAIPCDEEVVELDAILRIDSPLRAGESYRVIVNDRVVSAFSVPRAGYPNSVVSPSAIESAEIVPVDGAPPEYHLRVASGLSSGCLQYNGFEVRRASSDKVEVSITHHRVTEPGVVCTADYHTVETIVPLGSEFESGVEYKVSVNSEDEVTFVAR